MLTNFTAFRRKDKQKQQGTGVMRDHTRAAVRLSLPAGMPGMLRRANDFGALRDLAA